VEIVARDIYINMGKFKGVLRNNPVSFLIAILASHVITTTVRRISSNLTTISLPGNSPNFISGEKSIEKMIIITPIRGLRNVINDTNRPIDIPNPLLNSIEEIRWDIWKDKRTKTTPIIN